MTPVCILFSYSCQECKFRFLIEEVTESREQAVSVGSTENTGGKMGMNTYWLSAVCYSGDVRPRFAFMATPWDPMTLILLIRKRVHRGWESHPATEGPGQDSHRPLQVPSPHFSLVMTYGEEIFIFRIKQKLTGFYGRLWSRKEAGERKESTWETEERPELQVTPRPQDMGREADSVGWEGRLVAWKVADLSQSTNTQKIWPRRGSSKLKARWQVIKYNHRGSAHEGAQLKEPPRGC